ncbi:hypothetical protein ACWK0O_005333, partial [Escherichia coli]
MAEGRLTARNSKKAAQLRRVITMGYYSPAEILLHVLLFIPCRPRLPARAFFAHKKSPSGEGLRYVSVNHMHGAGCLPVSSVSAPEPAQKG